MALEFAGKGGPLTSRGLAAATDLVGVKAAEIWAVLTVETLGCGFLADKRPAILFERHVFHNQTGGRFDNEPDVSNQVPGSYGPGGAAQYGRLAKAITRDRTAALNSASWGIGQVMGFNATTAGFADVEAMVGQMQDSEDTQLAGMAHWVVQKNLHLSLRAHNWPSFARGYNGPNFAINQYDTRLASAYQKYVIGPLPDLLVRATQVYLMYLGFDPGPVDGVMGRKTRAALQQFETKEGLPIADGIDDPTFARLEQKATA